MYVIQRQVCRVSRRTRSVCMDIALWRCRVSSSLLAEERLALTTDQKRPLARAC